MRVLLLPVHLVGIVVIVAALHGEAFLQKLSPSSLPSFRRRHALKSSPIADEDGRRGEQATFNTQVAKQFKIVTCSATSCAAKRKVLTLDQYATFSAFWGRSQDIRVEETSCLGSCKKAPCVAVEHEDYEGTVALEGMDSFEFADRVFHRVIDGTDADRVWGIIENSIRLMAEQEDEDDESEDFH